MGITSQNFHDLSQFLITKMEVELDYYHAKVNVHVTARVSKRKEMKWMKWIKNMKLGNFKKMTEILELMASAGLISLKPSFDAFW